MAVVNTKSNAVTIGDSRPPTANQEVSPKYHGGRLKESVGFVAAGSADSIGSTYRLARVHSSVRVSAVLLSCTAVTGAAADIGICETADNGGAAVDADLFASAQTLASALTGTDVTHEAGTIGPDDIEKPLWQLLGLTSDPGKLYDVTATLTAAATAAGTVAVAVRFVDGN